MSAVTKFFVLLGINILVIASAGYIAFSWLQSEQEAQKEVFQKLRQEQKELSVMYKQGLDDTQQARLALQGAKQSLLESQEKLQESTKALRQTKNALELLQAQVLLPQFHIALNPTKKCGIVQVQNSAGAYKWAKVQTKLAIMLVLERAVEVDITNGMQENKSLGTFSLAYSGNYINENLLTNKYTLNLSLFAKRYTRIKKALQSHFKSYPNLRAKVFPVFDVHLRYEDLVGTKRMLSKRVVLDNLEELDVNALPVHNFNLPRFNVKTHSYDKKITRNGKMVVRQLRNAFLDAPVLNTNEVLSLKTFMTDTKVFEKKFKEVRVSGVLLSNNPRVLSTRLLNMCQH